MTDEPAAAIRATFSDLRIIKGRKQAQLILEVPIEEADNALAVLGGVPQPHSERWVAVARLNGVEKPEPEPKEKRKWEDLKLSMQASIRCNEPAFWKFIESDMRGAGRIRNAEDAGAFVRRFCQIDSRSNLNTNPNAALDWQGIEAQYQAWLKVAV
jgi:hypothetical protein